MVAGYITAKIMILSALFIILLFYYTSFSSASASNIVDDTFCDPRSLALEDKSISQNVTYLGYNWDLFTYIVESRNDPSSDPLIFWFSDLGCSSLEGLTYEIGPSYIDKDLNPVRNNHSWNSNATLVFVDAPAGVGMTPSDAWFNASTSEDMAEKLVDFFTSFWLLFQEKYGSLDYHLVGKSLAGHYLPQLAVKLHEYSRRPKHEGIALHPKWNVRSVVLSAPMVDLKVQAPAYVSDAERTGANSTVRDEIKKGLAQCNSSMDTCHSSNTQSDCQDAAKKCLSLPESLFSKVPDDSSYAVDYWGQSDVLKTVCARVTDPSPCSRSAYESFIKSGDIAKSSTTFVNQALGRGISVLVYVGDDASVHGLSSQEEWMNQLSMDNWNRQPFQNFTVDGSMAGKLKNSGNLTLLSINEAGDYAAREQPEAAIAMINRWIKGDRNLGSK